MFDEIPKLQKMYYIPNEPFSLLVQFIAEEDDIPYTIDDDFFVLIAWNSKLSELYTKNSDVNVEVIALTSGNEGIELKLTIPSDITKNWKKYITHGILHIKLGSENNAKTIAAGYLKPSMFSEFS